MQKTKKVISRRSFTKLSATALAGLPFMGFKNNPYQTTTKFKNEIQVHLFSKHLQFLDYEDMAAAASELGFDGLDLTVRPKGHVLPERVVDDLPKAVEAMHTYDIKPSMMTTNIWDSGNLVHRSVLETASKLGFLYYRTGWLRYPENRSITESQSIYAEEAKDLEKLNTHFGLVGCYQNHAGNHVGAPIWDLPSILDLTENKHIGCQYDIRHAVVEGGQSWELGLRLISPYIRSIVIKDFKWGKINGIWKPVNVPLGKGVV
ncbi:MAG: TIM barrel protein, partial [Bacteroidota bacterium]